MSRGIGPGRPCQRAAHDPKITAWRTPRHAGECVPSTCRRSRESAQQRLQFGADAGFNRGGHHRPVALPVGTKQSALSKSSNLARHRCPGRCDAPGKDANRDFQPWVGGQFTEDVELEVRAEEWQPARSIHGSNDTMHDVDGSPSMERDDVGLGGPSSAPVSCALQGIEDGVEPELERALLTVVGVDMVPDVCGEVGVGLLREAVEVARAHRREVCLLEREA